MYFIFIKTIEVVHTHKKIYTLWFTVQYGYSTVKVKVLENCSYTNKYKYILNNQIKVSKP